MTLLELVDRIEALDGPCIETDYLIGKVSGYDYQEELGGAIRNSGPRFTASLDAAMTLVPECHYWAVSYPANDDGSKSVFGYKSRSHATVQGTPESRHYGPTPALALCAAALRARAAL